jgi:hypothetical protein
VARTYEWRCSSDCSDGRCCGFRGRLYSTLRHTILYTPLSYGREEGILCRTLCSSPERTEHPQLTQVQPVVDGCTHAVQVNFIFRLSRLEHHCLIWGTFRGLSGRSPLTFYSLVIRLLHDPRASSIRGLCAKLKVLHTSISFRIL